MKRGNKKGVCKRVATLSLLAHARMRAGLTQEGLAALLGVSRVTVFNWEHGRCKPAKMAEILCFLDERNKK